MEAFFKRLWQDDSGQDATEYALLVVLIALAISGGAKLLGTNVNTALDNAATELDTQTSGS